MTFRQVRLNRGARKRQPRILIRRNACAILSVRFNACAVLRFNRTRALLSLAPLGVLRLNLLLAIEQGLDAAPARAGLERIERLLDAAQRHMQRHALLFPT